MSSRHTNAESSPDDEHAAVDVLLLSQQQTVEAGVTDMSACIETMEQVFRLLSENRVVMGGGIAPDQAIHGHLTVFPEDPPHPDIPEGGPDRRFSAMPAYVGGDIDKMGLKWYGSNVNNPSESGLPRSMHVIILNDPETGAPLVMMDGQAESAMRTGAVAGLGARYIKGSRADTATIIGPGVIGQTAALALDAGLDNLSDLYVSHPEQYKAEKFKTAMQDDIDATIIPTDDNRFAANHSDVIVSAASGSPPPKFNPQWMKDDALLIPLGDIELQSLSAFDPDGIFCDYPENDLEIARHIDWDVVEALGAAVDYNIGMELHPDDLRGISDLITSSHVIRPEGRSIFYPLGLPMEDVGWANHVYETAVKENIGTTHTLLEQPYFQKPY